MRRKPARDNEEAKCSSTTPSRQLVPTGDWRLWYNLGVAYQRLDRWKEAAGAYKSALDLNGNKEEIQKALAYARWRAEDRP